MGLALLAVLGVITIVAVAMLSPRLKVASPLILALIGLAVSVIPGVPPIHVPSAVILAVVLPPLLYAASLNLPLAGFRENRGSITALSVVLVIGSAVVTGYLLFLVFPDLPFSAALALGAVISPTDTIAATSIGKRLGLPPRLLSIMEGESLVNDASALVLLRMSLAAVAGLVTVWQIVGTLAFSVTVGVVFGIIVGYLTVWVRSRVADSVVTTALSFVVPFVAYIPAELLGASGVLSVVAAGLITGHLGATAFSAPARISERLNWRTFQFLLENGVFLLMGLEVKSILDQVKDHELSAINAIGVGLGLTVVLISLRAVVVALVVWSQRVAHRWGQRPGHSPGRGGGSEGSVGTAPPARLPIGWRGGIVLSWSGMRGVVTVAAAQSLPETFPYRPQLVLIAYTVAIVTLLVQGITLPAVIRMANPRRSTATESKAEFVALIEQLQIAGEERLAAAVSHGIDGRVVSEQVVLRVRMESVFRSDSARELSRDGFPGDSPQRQFTMLRRTVLRAERAALATARNRGGYTVTALARAQEMLDLEEARLDHQDDV